ncbi:MAG: hypothetical protein ACJ796_20525 [Gemmatimonadaceae bacterium]
MRLFAIPATIVGIAIAIVFFKLYGMLTRPDVPRPIATIVDQFAPGVHIGATVFDTRHSVAGMTYVSHLGFVGMPGQRDNNLPGYGVVRFAQVRLLLDEKTRAQPNPNPKDARIDAVEIVSIDPSATSQITNAFIMLTRTPPREGCLQTSEEGRLRDVHVWSAPNDRGGVALISDLGTTPTSPATPTSYTPPGVPTLTSVLAFSGKFEGGRTLRGKYTDASCALVQQPQ